MRDAIGIFCAAIVFVAIIGVLVVCAIAPLIFAVREESMDDAKRRPRATMEELGLAYQAFLGDGDCRTRLGRDDLMDALYSPIQVSRNGRNHYQMSFGEFIDTNKSKVELYEKYPEELEEKMLQGRRAQV